MLVKDLPPLDEEALAHFGIKGMRWGVRKPDDPLVGRQPGQVKPPARSNEHIVKAAIAIGAVAVGAILLKRGGFKLSTPASRKMALGGAKASLRILQRSGRVMGKTSVKLGSTVGKSAAKGGFKVGKLATKGAYSGALAGGKAAGRVVAQNGAKFYTNVIKKSALSTVKLGSHAMYKFTGRGTPIVNDVARKSINLSPTDLLLNVRADRLGRRR